jgi:hypothetical protein
VDAGAAPAPVSLVSIDLARLILAPARIPARHLPLPLQEML